MQSFKVFAVLLSYPQEKWLAALPELEDVLAAESALNGNTHLALAPLLEALREGPLIRLQEEYVATFDRNPSHSLHLYEHIHGESRERGPALVSLMEEYRKQGLEIAEAELPDYLPLFLEFLSLLPQAQALDFLAEAVHVIAAVGRRLADNGSAYARVLRQLEALSPVAAEPLTEPPVKDMDEAMEMFGPDPDGLEPLLKPRPEVAVVNFHPKPSAAALR